MLGDIGLAVDRNISLCEPSTDRLVDVNHIGELRLAIRVGSRWNGPKEGQIELLGVF